jgi:large subunit ribosomal protein L30
MAELKITLVKSTIGRLENQRVTAKTLGLTKMNKTVVKPDNAAIRGMINTISHLVEVEEIK